MFPALIPAQRSDKVVDSGDHIPPTPAFNQQFKHEGMMSEKFPLEQINQLLPLIRNGIKESRSKGAQELLTRIAINNRLLQYELSAIKIQAVVRKFCSTLRVRRIRRRMELFMKVTEDCAARYLEEFVLSTCIEMSMLFYRQHARFKLTKESVERSITTTADTMMLEIIKESILDVVNSTVSDAIDIVVDLR